MRKLLKLWHSHLVRCLKDRLSYAFGLVVGACLLLSYSYVKSKGTLTLVEAALWPLKIFGALVLGLLALYGLAKLVRAPVKAETVVDLSACSTALLTVGSVLYYAILLARLI